MRFTKKERNGLRHFADTGGLLFSDDCNHDIDGLYAKTLEEEMRRVFTDDPKAASMPKLPNRHGLYSSFFDFTDGPPQTSHELNGWGDDMVHDYLRAAERKGRIAILYSKRTTDASGTTTGATNAFARMTTPGSPSTWSSTR